MKKSIKTGLISLVITMSMIPVLAFAAPGIPHQFYGTVSFESGTTPDDLTVEAKLEDGIVVGSALTASGKYGYMPSLFFASKTEGEWNGETANFFVGGIDTGESFTLSKGGYTQLNLTVPGTVGTIEETDEDAVIENEIVAVAPSQPTNIKLGTSLSINVTSDTNTNATVEKIEKKSSGNVAVFSGKNFLNAYEIKITGENLNISVTMKYDDTGIDEDTVKPYKFDGTSWLAIDYSQDKTANTITFTISSGETVYGVFGSTVQAAPTGGTTGGGGGGGGVTILSTPTSTLSAAAQKVDANKDNKIDVLDFNALMVNWGSASANNVADFNGDDKVDVFDFNLLMINWTL